MVLKAIGIFFVALAILGAALPVLPTTPFLLVAASCFAKSSPRLHRMLLANRVFGPLIRDWQAHRSIPKKGKIMAVVSILLAVAWSCYVLESLYIKLFVIALVLGPLVYIMRIPLTENLAFAKEQGEQTEHSP